MRVRETRAVGQRVGDLPRVGGRLDVHGLGHEGARERIDDAHLDLEAAHQIVTGEERGPGADRRRIRRRIGWLAEEELCARIHA